MDAKIFNFIRATLRKASLRHKPRTEALNKACVGSRINPKSKRLAKHYTCANCLQSFPRVDIELDHIIPCGSLKSFDDLPGFCERLFCDESGFQCLCCECHKGKTTGKEK